MLVGLVFGALKKPSFDTSAEANEEVSSQSGQLGGPAAKHR